MVMPASYTSYNLLLMRAAASYVHEVLLLTAYDRPVGKVVNASKLELSIDGLAFTRAVLLVLTILYIKLHQPTSHGSHQARPRGIFLARQPSERAVLYLVQNAVKVHTCLHVKKLTLLISSHSKLLLLPCNICFPYPLFSLENLLLVLIFSLQNPWEKPLTPVHTLQYSPATHLVVTSLLLSRSSSSVDYHIALLN